MRGMSERFKNWEKDKRKELRESGMTEGNRDERVEVLGGMMTCGKHLESTQSG